MKRNLTSVLSLVLVLGLSAANRYVSLDGNDKNDGLSWQTALQDIQQAVNLCSGGDTVFLASGIYNQPVSLKEGVSLVGQTDIITGLPSSVLDGTGLNSRLITAANPVTGHPSPVTTIRNLILQNAHHDGVGGAAMLSGAITMSHCIVRGCSGQQAGGVLIKGDLAEASALGSRLEYCLVYNCSATGHNWPDAGGVANFDGTVSHCTIVNNYGDRYGGIHSESTVENSVMWGNLSEDGFVDPANYVSDESLSLHATNYANEGFESHFYAEPWLDMRNTAAEGPRFRYPTNFAGMPQSGEETVMMLSADFSLSQGSPLTGKAGCFTYVPRSDKPRSIDILEDTLYIVEGEQACLHAVVTPYQAEDKTLRWSASSAIVSVNSMGRVEAHSVGSALLTAITEVGKLRDSAVVVVTPKPLVITHPAVLLADSLYKMADYAVPSFMPFLIAKEAARADSSEQNLKALQAAIGNLQDKHTPYCMVANINGDPATRMAFCWFTNEGVTDGCVQLLRKKNATAEDFEHGKVITLSANTTVTPPLHYAISTSGILRAAKLDKHTSFTYVSHKALAEGLRPGSDYSWRVGTEGHWSKIAHFRTEGRREKSFSFVYMTDSHIQDRHYIDEARLCATAVAKNEPKARFCVFPGDFVDTGTENNSEWEWERWFEEALNPVIMQMPIVPTDGNHDDSPLLNYTYHFNTDSSFNTQTQVKPQFAGITYSFQYGDLLLMAFSMQDFWHGDYSYETLTSEYFSRDLGGWFRRQVSEHPKAKYRVGLVHKNLFSGSDHQRDKETPLMRETLLPVFKQCEVDLVLQGHDHTYEVIGPVDPDTRTPILSAITEQEIVPIDSLGNLTGKRGGTYDVSDGTLYFIGATCGAKRYTPLTREEMDKAYNTHRLHDYFDLFTGMFGQPGAPCYTRVTVTRRALLLDSYIVNPDTTTTLINSMRIVRTKKHK